MVGLFSITLASVAGIIFSIIYLLYDSLYKISYVASMIASVIDWFPVISGKMIGNITPCICLHIILTIVSYIFLVIWFFTKKKSFYFTFYKIWILAYVVGWIAFLVIK